MKTKNVITSFKKYFLPSLMLIFLISLSIGILFLHQNSRAAEWSDNKDTAFKAGKDPIKARPFRELKTALYSKRKLCGLSPIDWGADANNVLAGATPIRAEHITKLRGGIADIYSKSPARNIKPEFTDDPIVVGETPIRAIHFLELRDYLDNATCCGDGVCDPEESDNEDDSGYCFSDCVCQYSAEENVGCGLTGNDPQNVCEPKQMLKRKTSTMEGCDDIEYCEWETTLCCGYSAWQDLPEDEGGCGGEGCFPTDWRQVRTPAFPSDDCQVEYACRENGCCQYESQSHTCGGTIDGVAYPASVYISYEVPDSSMASVCPEMYVADPNPAASDSPSSKYCCQWESPYSFCGRDAVAPYDVYNDFEWIEVTEPSSRTPSCETQVSTDSLSNQQYMLLANRDTSYDHCCDYTCEGYCGSGISASPSPTPTASPSGGDGSKPEAPIGDYVFYCHGSSYGCDDIYKITEDADECSGVGPPVLLDTWTVCGADVGSKTVYLSGQEYTYDYCEQRGYCPPVDDGDTVFYEFYEGYRSGTITVYDQGEYGHDEDCCQESSSWDCDGTTKVITYHSSVEGCASTRTKTISNSSDCPEEPTDCEPWTETYLECSAGCLTYQRTIVKTSATCGTEYETCVEDLDGCCELGPLRVGSCGGGRGDVVCEPQELLYYQEPNVAGCPDKVWCQRDATCPSSSCTPPQTATCTVDGCPGTTTCEASGTWSECVKDASDGCRSDQICSMPGGTGLQTCDACHNYSPCLCDPGDTSSCEYDGCSNGQKTCSDSGESWSDCELITTCTPGDAVEGTVCMIYGSPIGKIVCNECGDAKASKEEGKCALFR